MSRTFCGFNQLFFASLAHFSEHAKIISSELFQKSPMSILQLSLSKIFLQPVQILVSGQDISDFGILRV